MTNEESIDFTPRLDFTGLSQRIESLKAEMAKCLVGQTAMTELLLTAILADGHVLIEGVPGIAKTLTAKLLSRTIATNYSRIQFTPDLMPSDVIGTSIFHPASGNFVFRKGPVFSNIVLIDEINRAPAKTQSALFEVMEERQISFDGITYPLDFPFIILATQNPVDHEGTYRLPEGAINQLDSINAVLSPEELSVFRKLAGEVHVEPRLKEYIVSIVAATRNHPFLYLGASPRASLALMHASKALAALRGKDFIVPEDIQELAFPVLRHRIVTTFNAEAAGVKSDQIVRMLLDHFKPKAELDV